MLEHGADPDQPYGNDAPLTWAIRHGGTSQQRLARVDRLLRAGATPQLVTGTGRSPVHLAALLGEGVIVARLISAGAQMDPLIAAAIGDRERVAAYIHDDPESVLAQRITDPDLPAVDILECAIVGGNVELVKDILAAGATRPHWQAADRLRTS